jgi:hypothetical protein
MMGHRARGEPQRAAASGDVGISDEDVLAPLASLAEPGTELVEISDMARYHDLFAMVEGIVLQCWEAYPELTDAHVLAAFGDLARTFDGHEANTLAGQVAMGVKAILIHRRRSGQRVYSLGEVASCVLRLAHIAREHESWDGVGYLKWVRTFFEGRMPRTSEELARYLIENEIAPEHRARALEMYEAEHGGLPSGNRRRARPRGRRPRSGAGARP